MRYRIIITAGSTSEYEVEAESEKDAQDKAMRLARKDMREASYYDVEELEELEAVGGKEC